MPIGELDRIGPREARSLHQEHLCDRSRYGSHGGSGYWRRLVSPIDGKGPNKNRKVSFDI